MLIDRSYGCRVSCDANAAANSWWQIRSQPWSLTWLRRALDSRITGYMREAGPSLTPVRLSVDLAEVRWKTFLLHASRRNVQSGCESTLRLDSIA